MNDPLEEAAERDRQAGKAWQSATTCKCGYWMQAIPRQNGQTWVCGDPECNETKFEEVKR